MRHLTVLLALVLGEAVTVVGPAYPPNAVNGGTVVAALQVSANAVRNIDILQGDAPFVETTRAALGRWRFKGAEDDHVLVVVSFRGPSLYASGSAVRNVAPAKPQPGLAYPKKVVEPAYPPNSLGEGSAVFYLDINEAGLVSKVKVVQGLGGLTDSCGAAVKQWQFIPSRSKSGAPTASKAYAVCVVRRPILAP